MVIISYLSPQCQQKHSKKAGWQPPSALGNLSTDSCRKEKRCFFTFFFESHTNLHHSQTIHAHKRDFSMFESHTNLHHSQTVWVHEVHSGGFESHTNLHHSQTRGIQRPYSGGLSPILIYIILKPIAQSLKCWIGLSPILIYIILKPSYTLKLLILVWVPY